MNEVNKVRNAYQKIKAGDVVYFKTFKGVDKAEVKSKDHGMLNLCDGGSLMSCDVLIIMRNGEAV